MCVMERGLRKIPYGVMNWERLVRECHFLDNTAYIRTLEDVQTPVFLRPKRFGKSLVCSMLSHYYDVALKNRFDELFGKTEIGRDPTPLRNSFLVLTFDFSTVQIGSLAEIEERFVDHVRLRVREFAVRYAKFADWSSALAPSSAAGMVDALRSVVKNAALPPLYVIVDEYDNFTNELVVSNRDSEYDAVCGHDNAGSVRETFFKAFFKSFKAGLSDGTVGRTYFTGVLPITLDDLSSGFNVGTPVQLEESLLGLVGFTQGQVERYVDEIFAEHGLEASWRPVVLGDLKRLYDGYHFLPDTPPLYNSTICNWYLRSLVADRKIPRFVIDANVRTDVGWFRRLARTTPRALEKVRRYVERGEGELADANDLSAKFGRARFFSDAFFPYALYYLGLLTFSDSYALTVPNLTVKNLFVDYYNELSAFKNVDEARHHFLSACRDLTLGDGTWRDVFEQFWRHYVKARIPVQSFDKINENFFRTAFTSRCLDAMTPFYSFETEYNTPEGRCDFLAIPKPGCAKRALLIEFKYFTKKELLRRAAAQKGRKATEDRTRPVKATPPKAHPETKAQALAYRDAVTRKPDWGGVPLDAVVVEIRSNRGYDWIPV